MLGEPAVDSVDRCEDERRFTEAAWPRSPLEKPAVARWRRAARATQMALLAFSILQYYFFDVHLTIMALPGARVLVGVS